MRRVHSELLHCAADRWHRGPSFRAFPNEPNLRIDSRQHFVGMRIRRLAAEVLGGAPHPTRVAAHVFTRVVECQTDIEFCGNQAAMLGATTCVPGVCLLGDDSQGLWVARANRNRKA